MRMLTTNPARKHCTRCWQYLLAGCFRPNARISSGLSSWCRECDRAYKRQWRAENPEKLAEYNESRRAPRELRKCSECGTEFVRKSNQVVCSRRCKDKRYARLHPEKLKEKKLRYQQRRRERVKAT
jgi:hypothetical protein